MGADHAIFAYSISAVVTQVSKAEHLFSFEPVMVSDLAGMSARTDSQLFPANLVERGLTLELVKDTYKTVAVDYLYFHPDFIPLHAKTAEQYAVLEEAWGNAIIAHPGVYLQHRAGAFSHILTTYPDDPYWSYSLFESDSRAESIVPNAAANNFITDRSWAWNLYGKRVLFPSARWGSFDGYIYILISLTMLSWLLALVVVHRSPASARLLAFGALLLAIIMSNTLVSFFLIPSALFRYVYATVFCAAFFAIITVGGIISDQLPVHRRLSVSNDAGKWITSGQVFQSIAFSIVTYATIATFVFKSGSFSFAVAGIIVGVFVFSTAIVYRAYLYSQRISISADLLTTLAAALVVFIPCCIGLSQFNQTNPMINFGCYVISGALGTVPILGIAQFRSRRDIAQNS